MDDVIRMTGVLDPRGGWQARECSLAKALSVVDNRVAFLVLREAFYGTTRFDEFVERVGASEPVIADRLRRLHDAGLLVKQPYREPGSRTRHGYRLSDKGHELLPALIALMRWADRWETPTGTGPVTIVHTDCGAGVDVELRCAEGHRVGRGDLALTANRSG